jgi:pyridoxal phosphate-dependent aminotransferase EpsN
MRRILLSVPHMGGAEMDFVQDAFASNWMSTVGPNLAVFEQRFGQVIGQSAVALSSGTAAIHLGLRLLGVEAGDEVFCQDLTFAASAFPILYQGAKPVFVDSERRTWNMDAGRLREALQERAKWNRLPKAVQVVHLFGQCAEMDDLLAVCDEFEVPILEDAAEAVGSSYRGRPAGTMGAVGAFSFNGNKIITTTGGGMLSSANPEWVEKARYWAQQAREPGLAYHHVDVGHNYRMSNVLAGVGIGQLAVLALRVQQRREIAFGYRDLLSDLPGISLMPQAPDGLHTNWLSVFLIDAELFGCSRDELIRQLDAAGIESRPVWKPMHMQPVFAGCERVGGEVARDLFLRGICLPSSSSLTVEDQLRVVAAIRGAARVAESGQWLEEEVAGARLARAMRSGA